ncbi:15893_t:CDS:2 [Funneliformis mosseae]|uniref:15893_t:CDS:1 n=1 Tax=Funneliformis mosseae TaxID=27381 RepID=A0A9N8YPQ0_FUNMO|nr:15893_t:CDS:2 [Funneliformis mosseae]
MSLKAELKHIKNKLASKIDELERLKSDTTSASEEQSSISNSDRFEKPLLCRSFKGNSSSHNNLAQYFVCRKKDKSILIYESSKVSTPILAHDNIDDTKRGRPSRSLLSNKELPIVVLSAGMVNNDNKYQTPPIIKFTIFALVPDYSHYTTASGNLFSGIYSQSEDTNVPKPTISKQSEAIL